MQKNEIDKQKLQYDLKSILNRKTLLSSIVKSPLNTQEKLILARLSLSCPFNVNDKSDNARVELMLNQRFMFDEKKYDRLEREMKQCVILIKRSSWHDWMSKNTFDENIRSLCLNGYINFDVLSSVYKLTALAVEDGKGGGVLNSIWNGQTMKLSASERWAMIWFSYRKSFARNGFYTLDDAITPIDISISIWMHELGLKKQQTIGVLNKLTSKNLLIKHQDKIINSFSLGDVFFKPVEPDKSDFVERYNKALDHWLKFKKEEHCTEEDDGVPIGRLCEKYDLKTIVLVIDTLFTSKDVRVNEPNKYRGIHLEMDFEKILKYLMIKKKYRKK